jgi:hypothetical protein
MVVVSEFVELFLYFIGKSKVINMAYPNMLPEMQVFILSHSFFKVQALNYMSQAEFCLAAVRTT